MNRRQFIRWSGAAIGTLVFSSRENAEGAPLYQIMQPSKVFAVLDDGEHELHRDGNAWSYRDVRVRFTSSGSGSSVIVDCPTLPLQFIRLEWSYPLQKTRRIMGDHWERTYGDLEFHPLDANRKMPGISLPMMAWPPPA